MNSILRPAPVKKAIVVEAPIENAFGVFTAGLGRWWPASHSIGQSPLKTAVLEPRVGGRWYEVGQDGSECQWGEVLEWDEPRRIVLAWRVGADWRYDPTLLTEVEIRFTLLDENTTHVELEHRLLENMGEAAERARQQLESEGGWSWLLAQYRAEAVRSVV